MKVLAVSGSLRADSFNTSLLRAAARSRAGGRRGRALRSGRPRGAAAVRPGSRHAATSRESVERLREAWGSADAILFATPEYNGSVPGGLKNAIDWASRPRREAALMNQTVAVVGASTGQFGAMWAQADLRKILGTAGARVVGDELPVTRAHEKFDPAGRLLDGELFERLRLVLETLAAESISASDVDGIRKGPLTRAPIRYTSLYW